MRNKMVSFRDGFDLIQRKYMTIKRADRVISADLEGDVRGSDESGGPGDDGVQESDEGQEGDQIGDDVEHQHDRVGRPLSCCIQHVRLLPVRSSRSKFEY